MSNHVEFQLDLTLDSNQWFSLQLSDEQKESMIQPYLEYIDSTADVNQITSQQYEKIQALFLAEAIDGSHAKLTFNRIYPRLCIASKTFLKFYDLNPEVYTQENSVEFTGKVDAYWDGETLYFKNYSHIKPLFKGIADIYREASREEVQDFINTDLFVLDEGFNADKIGERARKNIASILDSNDIDLNCDATRVVYKDYAQKYPELDFQLQDDGKFHISSNKALTDVISILQERVYTTPISNEKKVANSTVTVSET